MIIRLGKHLIISGISGAIDFTLITIMIYAGLKLIWAYSLAFICATIFGYLGHTYFTFNINKIIFKKLILYFMQILIVFLVGYFLIKILLDSGVHIIFAKLIQLTSTFFINFFINKSLTFKNGD